MSDLPACVSKYSSRSTTGRTCSPPTSAAVAGMLSRRPSIFDADSRSTLSASLGASLGSARGQSRSHAATSAATTLACAKRRFTSLSAISVTAELYNSLRRCAVPRSAISSLITCSVNACFSVIAAPMSGTFRFDTFSSAVALTVGSAGVAVCLYLLFCVRFSDVAAHQCVIDDSAAVRLLLAHSNNETAVTLSWHNTTSSCSHLGATFRDCLLNATRHHERNALRFSCFALDDDLYTVFLSARDAEFALSHAPVSTLAWLLFAATALILCLPCCFVGGSLMCCLAFGFDVPILNRLMRFRCDVPTDAKQV
jgi:hypothetical protein